MKRMKLRKYISLLLFAVYLFAAGGQAVASLSCHCVAMKAHVAHFCCHHCSHDDAASSAAEALGAPCCGNHHSTLVELYTASSEAQKQVRCTIICLPPALAVECPCPEHIPFLREACRERCAPFVKQDYLLPVGFRAPPALV